MIVQTDESGRHSVGERPWGCSPTNTHTPRSIPESPVGRLAPP